MLSGTAPRYRPRSQNGRWTQPYIPAPVPVYGSHSQAQGIEPLAYLLACFSDYGETSQLHWSRQ